MIQACPRRGAQVRRTCLSFGRVSSGRSLQAALTDFEAKEPVLRLHVDNLAVLEPSAQHLG